MVSDWLSLTYNESLDILWDKNSIKDIIEQSVPCLTFWLMAHKDKEKEDKLDHDGSLPVLCLAKLMKPP